MTAGPDGNDADSAAFRPDLRAERGQPVFQAASGLTAPPDAGGFCARTPRDMAVPRTPEAACATSSDTAAASVLRADASIADIFELQTQSASAALAPRQPPTARPTPRPADPEELARAHAAGILEGKALAERELVAQKSNELAQLSHLRDALVTALRQLAHPPADAADALNAALDDAVARLASERAGQAIDAAPAPFARRLARLAQRLSREGAGLIVRLNPADHAALLPLIAQDCPPELAQLAEARIVPDSGLRRGDAALRVPGIHLSDLLGPAPVSAHSGKTAA